MFLTTVFYTTRAQHRVAIRGVVQDSTGVPLQGCSVKLLTENNDSLLTTAMANGLFFYKQVTAKRITLTLAFNGYTGLVKHYVLDSDSDIVNLGIIRLEPDANLLNPVTVSASLPVTIKEDTVTYNVSAFKVRDNAMLEDALKKMPGIDVDVNGNVTAQGKQVTKVKVNGKDFFGGDVKTATQNLPANIVENVQIIDDYGDQASLTGIKTGDPNKVMNITIRPDKNHGFTGQATAGDGSDILPTKPGIQNDNRYIGAITALRFNGAQQLSLLGNINNANVNLFSFGTPTTANAVESKKLALENTLNGKGGASAGFTPQTNGQNGITTTRSAGFNYRDQWGKKLSVYGSYSFGDNTVVTQTNMLQQNTSLTNSASVRQSTSQTSTSLNHRFNWNMEYKPDSLDYIKVTPVFSYAFINSHSVQTVASQQSGVVTAAYTSLMQSTYNASSYGIIALYNHRFKGRGRNLSVNVTANTGNTTQHQHAIFNYTSGSTAAPDEQLVATSGRVTNYGITTSYLMPAGEYSYMEVNYAFNRSLTTNNRQTTVPDSAGHNFIPDSALSNRYNYTFTTHRFSLNYRYIKKTVNYIIGLGVEPAALSGIAPATSLQMHQTAVNIAPEGRLVFNFGKSKSLSFGYTGYSSQPAFNQLQPVIDFTNALYPVQGNPALKPQFTSNFSARYNKFDFASGNTVFTSLNFSQVQNQVVTNTISYPARYQPNPALQNTWLTQFENANGYYTASAFGSFAKPWHSRRYTIIVSGNISYTHNTGFLTSIDSINYASTTVKNNAGNLSFSPLVRFRVDVPDKVDVQFSTSYLVSNTHNTVQNNVTVAAANTQTFSLGINGKNYILKDWTVSYEYFKDFNYGYLVPVNNPNILNVYLERRFLKNNKATIRLAAFDVFNQSTGYNTAVTASTITQTSSNKLGRYYLLTFTLRLQKFGGK